MLNILNKIVGFHGTQYFGKDVYRLGGGQTGGSVVSTVPASVANAAGQFGVQAANEASNDATQAIGSAIQATNAQFQLATSDLQPATQEGVQALDQLNSYIGLTPYNPSAPTAPTAPTLQSLEAGITQQDVDSYITENSTPNFNSKGQFFGNYDYQGIGAGTNAESLPGVGIDTNSGDTGAGALDASLSTFENNAGLSSAITTGLAQQELNNPNSDANLTYGIENTAYQGEETNYQQANALYNQYTAQGPLTANEVQNNITNEPGYQAQLQQGTQAIDSDASAKGYLGSGQMLKELQEFGQNTLSQFYGNTLTQLSSLAGAGQQAATSQASLATSEGNSLSNLLNSLGQDQANAALSAGNSLSQAAILGGTQYQTLGQSSSSSGLAGIGSILGSLGGVSSTGSTTGILGALGL